jgi:hypothetical protein
MSQYFTQRIDTIHRSPVRNLIHTFVQRVNSRYSVAMVTRNCVKDVPVTSRARRPALQVLSTSECTRTFRCAGKGEREANPLHAGAVRCTSRPGFCFCQAQTSLFSVQNGSHAHPASYVMDTGALSSGLKHPEHEADDSFPSSGEAKNASIRIPQLRHTPARCGT